MTFGSYIIKNMRNEALSIDHKGRSYYSHIGSTIIFSHAIPQIVRQQDVRDQSQIKAKVVFVLKFLWTLSCQVNSR